MFGERKNKRHCSFTTFNIPFFFFKQFKCQKFKLFQYKKSYTFSHNSLKEWLIQPLQKWLPIATQQFFLSLSLDLYWRLPRHWERTYHRGVKLYLGLGSPPDRHSLFKRGWMLRNCIEMHNNNWIDTINWGLQCFFDNLYDN